MSKDTITKAKIRRVLNRSHKEWLSGAAQNRRKEEIHNTCMCSAYAVRHAWFNLLGYWPSRLELLAEVETTASKKDRGEL